MRKEVLRTMLIIMISGISFPLFSQDQVQNNIQAIIDSLRRSGVILREERKPPEISLSREQSIEYLRRKTSQRYWNNPADPFRRALDHLVFEASHDRYDSVETFLRKYPYDSLHVSWDRFYIWEPLKIRIPVTPAPQYVRPDTVVHMDTTRVAAGDTLDLDPVNVILETESHTAWRDTSIMVVIDTLEYAIPRGSPFRYEDYPYQSDSIRVAVSQLLDYLERRDSTVVWFRGLGNSSIPVWMNTKSRSTVRRYWLKNEFSDSVTVWIGNEDKNTFGLYLEQGINFRKPMRQEDYSVAKINVEKVDRSKLHKHNITVKRHDWNYRTESSLLFSQSALSNWVKGGENSIATALDLTGFADYKRPEIKLTSANFARLKLGFQSSGDEIRKNLDLLETNSKLNHKAFGKFDFSAIMLFKTQVAVGKQYTKKGDRDTSFVVSRFFNPAILTLGIGLDYKPNKETSINLSPLSYKGTFVPAAGKITKDDPVPDGKIDQTRYGVPLEKKSKHEPGASFMISKVSKPMRDLTVTNRLQLFTNYINNPLNIDVDWEMIMVYNLNWFTDLRLNTHLIFDDDTRTTVMKGGKPEKLEDGSDRKTARIQFKELFGVSLSFKF